MPDAGDDSPRRALDNLSSYLYRTPIHMLVRSSWT